MKELSRTASAVQISSTMAIDALAKQMKAEGVDVIGFGAGEPDFNTPAHIKAAADRAIAANLTRYTPASGTPELKEAVCQRMREDCGLDYKSSQVVVSTGAKHCVYLALRAVVNPGDEIILPAPYWVSYLEMIKMVGGQPVVVTAGEGARFKMTAEQLAAAITPKTKALILNNPGNPTGAVLTREEQRLLVDICKEHGLFLVSDEVYREIIYSGEPLSSLLEFEDAAENIIVTDSISKRFSSCGARVGALISRNRHFMELAMKICQGRLCAATLDQLGAAALYQTMTPEYLRSVRDEYGRRKDALVAALSKLPGVTHSSPEGAFYVMATLPVDDAEKLQYFLLQEFEDQGETVMYAPGEGFYATPGKGKNEVRIAYVTQPKELTRAIELLGLGIEAYNRKNGK